jgi:hypothetical protein
LRCASRLATWTAPPQIDVATGGAHQLVQVASLHEIEVHDRDVHEPGRSEEHCEVETDQTGDPLVCWNSIEWKGTIASS